MSLDKSIKFEEAFKDFNSMFLPKGSKRMTREEWDSHYKSMLGRCWDLCPDGTVHDYKENRENSKMCNTEYVCIKCGFYKRVDSSD